jgi:hypothetical protein
MTIEKHSASAVRTNVAEAAREFKCILKVTTYNNDNIFLNCSVQNQVLMGNNHSKTATMRAFIQSVSRHSHRMNTYLDLCLIAILSVHRYVFARRS